MSAIRRRLQPWRRRAMRSLLRRRGAEVGTFESINLDPYETLSLDVFDTCVGRAVWAPHDIFYLAAAAVGDGDPTSASTRALAEARIAAEAKARQRSAAAEVSLDEIYAEPEFRDQVADHVRGRMQVSEVDHELRYSMPRADTRRGVERARESGLDVRYLSDMYLPERIVTELIDAAAFPPGFVEVSSETGRTKASGAAFADLANSGAGTTTLHVGDNTRVDGIRALQAGVGVCLVDQAQQVYRSQPMEYQLPPSAPIGDGIVWSVAAHVALEAPGSADDSLTVAWRTGALSLGPLMAAFASRLVDDIGDESVAMFSSRDMRLVQEVYATLCPNRRHHYLELSRRSVGLPAMAGGLTPADKEFLIGGRGLLTEKQLWERLGLDPPGRGVEVDRPLAQADREPVWERMQEHSDMLVARAQAELQEFANYWTNSGFPLHGRVTLVDVGWRGTVQLALNRCLNHAGIQVELDGSYLALLDSPPAAAGPARGWIVDGGQPSRMRLSFEAGIPIVELSLQADEGTVVSYRDGVACRGPRVGERSVQNHLQLGARAMCSRWLELDPPTRPSEISVLPMLRLLSRPTPAEAHALGQILHTDRMGSSSQLVPVLPSVGQARRALLSTRGWTTLRSSEWRPGLLALVGVPPSFGRFVDVALRGIKLVGRTLVRLRSTLRP